MITTPERHAVPEPLLVAMSASGSDAARDALAAHVDRVAAAKHASRVSRERAAAPPEATERAPRR
jgi:hypothetical protein